MTEIVAPEGYELTAPRGFNVHGGPVFVRKREDGTLHFILDIEDRHMNMGGVVHGGVLMSMADVTLGVTVFEKIGRKACATINLDCNFLAAGKLGDRIQGTAEVVRETRDVVFVEGRLYTEKRTLMTAQGIWKILHTTPPFSDPV